jgi:DnaA initiator-associating protein
MLEQDLINRVKDSFSASIQTKLLAQETLPEKIVAASHMMATCLAQKNKILCCGNGGSAGDAQHFAGEMLNRFLIDRPPLAAMAISTDTSTLTAISNDTSYDNTFSNQVYALGREGDILLAISTSGNSKNIIKAIETAHEKSMLVIALTGRDGGEMAKILLYNQDIEIRVIGDLISPRIQETHILVLHCLCDLVEQQLFGLGK